MKSFISLIAVFSLCSCKNYSGPSIGFTAGHEGVSAGLTLYGKPKPVALPAINGLAK